MIRIRNLIGLLMMSGLLAACSGGGSSAPAANAGVDNNPPAISAQLNEPSLPLDERGVQVIARVNNTEITLPQFELALARSRDVGDSASYDALVDVILRTLIEQIVIHQAAEQMGILVDDALVEREFQATRSLMTSDSAWQEWLRQNHFTEELFRESLRDFLVTEQVRDARIDMDSMRVTEVHARHILVATEEEARALIQRLIGGESFAQLAAQYSLDSTTNDQGGDLGWFTAADLVTPELATVASRLQPGQFTGPVRTVLGYHIVELLGSNERPASPEEQYRMAAIEFESWLQTLVDAALIERYIN